MTKEEWQRIYHAMAREIVRLRKLVTEHSAHEQNFDKIAEFENNHKCKGDKNETTLAH